MEDGGGWLVDQADGARAALHDSGVATGGCSAVGAYGEAFGQRAAQFGAAGTGHRTQSDRRNGTTAVALDARGQAGQIAFVEHPDLRHRGGADFRQHRVHRGNLLVAIGRRCVDHVQQQIGLGGLGQRRPECRDEVVGQVANEADGVGHHDRVRVGHVDPAQRRVERGEQLVRDVGASAGHPIEERRLARRWCSRPAPRCAPGARRRVRLCTAWLRATRARRSFRSFTRSPMSRRSVSSCVSPGPRRPMPPFCRSRWVQPPTRRVAIVLQLRELDLQLALGAAGAQREDVEDQARAGRRRGTSTFPRGCAAARRTAASRR